MTPDLHWALATRISWAEPFDVVPAAALGPHSPWANTLSRVLRTPQPGWRHAQFIAMTGEAGDVAVHTAWARDGLLVTSVAAGPGVPAADVLAAAYRVASAIAVGGPLTMRCADTVRSCRRQVMPAARIPAAGITCRPCQLLP